MTSRPSSTRGAVLGRAGFTMVELLAALVVVGLLTATVCVGVTAAMRTYEQEQFASQSQMLSGMVENALSDPLRFMTFTPDDNEPDNPSELTYKVTYRNISMSDPKLVAEGGRIYLTGKYGGQTQTVPLLNDGAYGNCDVSSASLTVTPDLASGTAVSTVHVVIERGDKAASFDYTFKSLGNNVTKQNRNSS